MSEKWTIENHKWPTREEWAERERTPYGDDVYDSLQSRMPPLRDYITDAEIAGAITQLEELQRTLHRQMREGRKAIPHLLRQRGQTPLERVHQYYDEMSQEDRDRLSEQYEGPREHCRHIRRLISILNDKESRIYSLCYSEGGDLPKHYAESVSTLIEILRRMDVTRERIEQEIRDEFARRPIDDAAWEKELGRRAQVTQYLTDPSSRIITT